MTRHFHFRTWIAMAASVATLAALPSVVAAQDTTANAIAEGARVYGATCGRCHNPRSPLERSDRDWVTIANHMRVRANLTGEQVRSVLAFLEATNNNPAQPSELATTGGGQAPARATAERPVSTDDAVIARGHTIVQQKACLGCHVIGNAGGNVGPSLNGVVGRRGATFVWHKLSDPTFDNATSMMPNFGLSDDQIEAIVAYLNTLDGGN